MAFSAVCYSFYTICEILPIWKVLWKKIIPMEENCRLRKLFVLRILSIYWSFDLYFHRFCTVMYWATSNEPSTNKSRLGWSFLFFLNMLWNKTIHSNHYVWNKRGNSEWVWLRYYENLFIDVSCNKNSKVQFIMVKKCNKICKKGTTKNCIPHHLYLSYGILQSLINT